MLRGVYAERSERAQDDREGLSMAAVADIENHGASPKAADLGKQVCACIFFFPCISVLFFQQFPKPMNLACGRRSAAALLGGRARQRPESTWRFSWGITVSVELVESGGGGRSALRPGGNSRACRVDRPPALFSHAEENPRPYEPAYSSSTGDGTGSGGPDRKLNSRRVL